MRKLITIAWPYLLAFAFWALLIDLSIDSCENSSLKKENEQLRYDLAHAQIHVPPERFYIHDTVEVIHHETTVVEKLKPALSPEERQLLKDVGAKLQTVESLYTLALNNSATVTLSPDTTQQPTPNTLSYSDHWAHFSYDTSNSQLSYSVRDSLTTVVSRLYRHRFLWFRWGLKGYDVHIANHNPNATIVYDHFLHK